MPTPEEVKTPHHIGGYAECHFCTVSRKRRSWRCVACTGRQGLRERLLRSAEDRLRRRVAAVLSLILPGLGHLYRSSPGTGFFFFSILASAIGYLYWIEGEMTSGRWSAVAVLAAVHVFQAIDAGRGPAVSTAPCQEACPADVSCAHYVNLIRDGLFREALEMVEVGCPFPGTVGRVCHHPCEQNCRRAEEGEAIAICALKRFLADNATSEDEGFFRSEQPPSDVFEERVAVIGAGPSGLSAALYLKLMGFPVTIFEAGDEPGGMPAAVIPDYRLPAYVYREEIGRILALGIEVKTGMELGKDFSLQELGGQGFSAAYVALGAQRSVRLPHCGTTEEGFLDGLEFLRAAKAGKGQKLHGKVIVIGGGNVAVDVAKTAVRLGAEAVRKVFLESRETMPAHAWECEEALEEGVRLIPSTATISFDIRDGRVAGALCRRVERIDMDEKGRIKPVLFEGTDFSLEADWVITAVGTGPDYGVFEGRPEMKPFRGGVRAGRMPRSLSGGIVVVAGGDFFSGPSSVIEAIAAGREGAMDIYRQLGKSSIFRKPSWRRVRTPKYPGYFDEPGLSTRKHMSKVDPEIRCESFCEVCESYESGAAEMEAARCLRCCWPIHKEKKPAGQPSIPDRKPPPPVEPIPPGEGDKATKEFF